MNITVKSMTETKYNYHDLNPGRFDLPKAGLKTVDGFLTRVEVGRVKVLLAFFTLILETEKKKVFS